MPEKIRFGFLGLGKIAMSDHIPALKALADRVEITAAYDPVPGKVQSQSAIAGIAPKVCCSEEDLLSQDIDAVIIATPNVLHYPQTIAALKAGKHVLVEKPMSFSTAQADEMVNLALEKGLVLQVNQSRRYNALLHVIKKEIDNGLIGDILHFRSQRTMTRSPEMSWSPGAYWFIDPAYEGSLVGDIAVHMSDAMDWFCGRTASLSAVTRKRNRKVEDEVFVLFNYESGAIGTMELSWNFPTGFRSDEIYGTKGTLRLCCGGLAFEFIPAGSTSPAKVFTAPAAGTVANSQECFLDAIATGSKSAWEFGRNAIALVEAIRLAGTENQVKIPAYRKK